MSRRRSRPPGRGCRRTARGPRARERVVAGLDLQLDAAVALGEMAIDGLQELADHPRGSLPRRRSRPRRASRRGTRPAACRWLAGRRRGSPSRPLPSPSGGRGRAPGSPRRPRPHVAEREESGKEVAAHDVLCALDVLRRVERLAERDALAPTFRAGPTTCTRRTSRSRSVPRDVLKGATSGRRGGPARPRPASSREHEPAVPRDRVGAVAVRERASDRVSGCLTPGERVCGSAWRSATMSGGIQARRVPSKPFVPTSGRPSPSDRRMTTPSPREGAAIGREAARTDRSETSSHRTTARSLAPPAFRRSRSRP